MNDFVTTEGRLAFEQMVFSGGGTRCFWHGGFMDVIDPLLARMPERIVAVSGGALAATCFIARCETRMFEAMADRIEAQAHNISTNWDEVQDHGLTPHQQLYKDVVQEVLGDREIEAIADGPDLRILLSRPLHDKLPEISTIPMMMAYEADLAVRSTPHVIFPNKLGSDEELIDARKAAREGKLHKLICSAAVIPPVFNVEGWEGRPVVDGGMTNKAPLPEPDRGETLILLTRKFRNLPTEPARHHYVEPSESVPADKIDFTDRGKIEETWKQGHEDAKLWLARHGVPKSVTDGTPPG